MIRAVIAILIGLPMLMPPGMCLCEYLPCPADVNAASEAGSPGREETPPQTHRCSCGHRRLLAEVGREADGETVESKHIPSGPSPQPEKHHPGCPVVDKYQSRFVARAETAVPPPAIVAATDFIAVDEFAVTIGDQRTIASASVPLVISHGPLLI